MIKAIVAVGKNWEIGKNNALLFHIKADMQHFQAYTTNKIVVCGANTLKSFPGGRPLKGRSTIVLCSEGQEYEDCICIHNFDKLVHMLKVLAVTQTVYVIGGGMLYKALLPYCEQVLVTKINASDPTATVFFPNLDKAPDFVVSETSHIQAEGSYEYSFVTYSRVQPELELEKQNG